MKSLSVIFAITVLATISFAQGHGGYGGGGHRAYVASGGYGGHGYGGGGFSSHSVRGYAATPAGRYHGFVSGAYGGRGYHGYGVSIGSGYAYGHSAYVPGYYGHYGYGASSYPYLGHGYYSDPYVSAFPPPVAGGVVVVTPSHVAPNRVLAGSRWRRFGGH